MEKTLKKHWFLISIALILIVGVIVRFYKLGVIPHGMTWDEAAIGYNGFSVLNTRRDEWLDFLPISFQSFGDYKAPLAIYLNGVFTALLGMNLFAVRLPFALSSLVAILAMMWLVYELYSSRKESIRRLLTVFSGFLLTVSSWHIHYSRAGFESGMALALILLGLAALYRYKNSKLQDHKFIYFAVFMLVASIYTYHSSKVFIPLFGLYFLWSEKNIIKKYFKKFLAPGIVFMLLLLPFLYDSFYGEGLTRAGVTLFSDPSIKFTDKLSLLVSNFISHLSPTFLIFGETTTLRHGIGDVGVLYPTTLFLSILGLYGLFNSDLRKRAILGSIVVFIGILPAALSTEIPHSNRSFFAITGFIILALIGIEVIGMFFAKSKSVKNIIGSHGEKHIVMKAVIGTLLALHVVFSVNFLSRYFTEFSANSTEAFRDGYIEALTIAHEYEMGLNGKPEVEKVLFSSEYGQPYIYALFVKEMNPIEYRGGALIKYEFSDSVSVGELVRENTLVVGTQASNLPTRKADHVVYGSDGSERFVLIYTGPEGIK